MFCLFALWQVLCVVSDSNGVYRITADLYLVCIMLLQLVAGSEGGEGVDVRC